MGAEAEEPPPYRLLLDRVPQPVAPVPLSRFMQSALARLMTDEEAWPFLEPVSAEEVPDYHTIIKVGYTLNLKSEVNVCFAAGLGGLIACRVMVCCSITGSCWTAKLPAPSSRPEPARQATPVPLK